jgi:hypothetical protein
MKSKNELKSELAVQVAAKIQNTHERRALKAVPFAVRTSEQHTMMLRKWWTNSDLKEAIRHLGLAYAFVRGRSYWVTERSCIDGPNAVVIASLADVTAEEVLAWLEVRPSQEELDAYEQHLATSRERTKTAKVAARARRAAA